MNIRSEILVAGTLLSCFAIVSACGDDGGGSAADAAIPASDAAIPVVDAADNGSARESSASYTDVVLFSGSASTTGADVYEVLPGPAAIDPSVTPTPFSDSTVATTGNYSFVVLDTDAEDSAASTDAVTTVDIRFTGNNGTNYLIDAINVIHKPLGAGDHTFFGGVGLNKMMHGDTGVGTPLMPKMLAYLTLWGIVDLKDADTGATIATGRVIHIMSATGVRDADKNLGTEVVLDGSDHDRRVRETHIILPPANMAGDPSPIPGTDHGFLHLMYSNVTLTDASRDATLAYEILPGPAVINPAMSPTPFSDRIAIAAGNYTLKVTDFDAEDSPESRDRVDEFTLSFRTDDGKTYTADGINVIHKENGSGDHTFMGGVGYDATMHGDSGIGTGLMPKLQAYITLWGTVDLLDESGSLVAANRMIHIMVASRVRSADLALSTDVATDTSDTSDDMIETHIIMPPQALDGTMSPIPGTRHGFLHLMFEKVNLTR